MPANKDLLYYNQTTAAWEGVHSGAISDGTNIITPSKIGVLSSLTTTDKTSTVAAINENVNKIGLLSSLTTSNKTSVVAAIDELQQMPVNAMSRQALINGNFDVWQRGASFVAPSNGAYFADRWKVLSSPDGGTFPSVTISRQSLTSGDITNSRYFTRASPNGSGTSMGANSYYTNSQNIENGTTFLCGIAKKVTVSFWARSSISGKKIGVYLQQNYGTGGSPSSPELITGTNFTLTSQWVKYTHTFTTNSLVGKTFGTNSDDSLMVSLIYLWGTSNSVGTVVAETFVGSGDIDITQIQVCSGDVALPFQPRIFGEEWQLCQRYYEKSYQYADTPASNTYSGAVLARALATNEAWSGHTFLTVKRTIPTVTIYGKDGTFNKLTAYGGTNIGTSITPGTIGTSGIFALVDSGTGLTAGATYLYQFTADAEI